MTLTSRWLSCLLGPCLLAGGVRAEPVPRLVVVISIDQCRADYLERFRPFFGPDGFNRLLDGGVDFTDCHYRHAITVTGPGHALMLTGVDANVNGVIGDEWRVPDWPAIEMVNCVEDRAAPLVGAATPPWRSPGGVLEVKRGRSPRPLLASTVGDQLKLRYGARSKVFGLAEKDRAAILMTGRLADGAYWFDEGRLVTSTYYRPALPDYLAAINAERRIEQYFGREWDRLLAPAAYEAIQGPDDAAGESAAFGLARTFPKRLDGGQAQVSKDYYEAFHQTPWSTELVADLARELIVHEKLGEDDGAPDVLALGFSQIDRIGHAYGPDSQELMDSMVRLDRTLAGLFHFLDGKIGRPGCLIVLTADHGVPPLPERIQSAGRGLAAGRLNRAELDAQVIARLDAKFGPLASGERWVGRDGPGYLLNPAALAQKQLAAPVLEAAVRDALLSLPGIATAYTRTQLVDPAPLDAIGEAMRLSFYPPRSPDVLFVPQPYFMDRPTPTGTTHGSPYDYDNHVPLLWWGAGIKPGVRNERVGVDDLAPTLAHLLGVPAPPQAAGRILF
jgi:hypothetical protein